MLMITKARTIGTPSIIPRMNRISMISTIPRLVIKRIVLKLFLQVFYFCTDDSAMKEALVYYFVIFDRAVWRLTYVFKRSCAPFVARNLV